MSSSDLLKNIERSLYTFNFNNIVELCFSKIIKYDPKNLNKINTMKLSEQEKVLFDNCIDKYMLSFNIVKDQSIEHIDNLINRRV
jgi:hypothetical protein